MNSSDMTNVILKGFLQQIDNSTKQVYQSLWHAFLVFLNKHWLFILVSLFVILIIAFMQALMGHRWMLGKVLYNYLYFGILFIVALLLGTDIFVSNIFTLLSAIVLYPICYFIVGRVYNRIGV